MDSPKCIYKKLKDELGRSDAACEYIELLIRSHETKMTEQEIQQLSDEYGVRVNSVDPVILTKSIHSMYFMLVDQQLELFSKEMIGFLKKYSRMHIKEKEDGENYIKYLYKQNNELTRKNCEEYVRYLICDYYHHARNAFVHVNDSQKPETLYKELQKYFSIVDHIRGNLPFPNTPFELSFDDFILFSRTAKGFACDCLAKIEQDDIIDPGEFAKHYNYYRFAKYKVGSEKWEKAVRNDLTQFYGFGNTTQQCIIDTLSEL